jgi:hypothetical protein
MDGVLGSPRPHLLNIVGLIDSVCARLRRWQDDVVVADLQSKQYLSHSSNVCTQSHEAATHVAGCACSKCRVPRRPVHACCAAHLSSECPLHCLLICSDTPLASSMAPAAEVMTFVKCTAAGCFRWW